MFKYVLANSLIVIFIIFCIAACSDKKVAENNTSISISMESALESYKINNFPDALLKFERLATDGNKEAQFYLATMYLNGQGVPLDKKIGIKWLILSSEQGFSFAQNDLAGFYYRGEVVDKDLNLAVKLWRLASAQGSANAAESLANLEKKKIK